MATTNGSGSRLSAVLATGRGIQTAPITSITVGDRVRGDVGDLDVLADSITEVGLLHPIVVDRDFNLIAGARRLAACRQLGWDEIVPLALPDTRDMSDQQPVSQVQPDPILDTPGAARYLHTSERHIKHLVAQGALPHLYVGRFCRFFVSDLHAYALAHRVEATA